MADDTEIPHGVIQFHVEDKEVLRFEPSGKMFIYGEQIDDNQKVYKAFVAWMTQQRCVSCHSQITVD